MSILSSIKNYFAGGVSSGAERRASLENPSTPIDVGLQSLIHDSGGLTIEKIAGYPPVAQAVGMIAGDCAALPLHVYKRLPDGAREKASDHPVESLVNLWGDPNEEDQTAFDLWFDFFHDALLRGLGLLWIERRGAKPIGLYRLDPDAWRPVRVNRRRYWVNQGTPPIVLPESDVIHHSGVRLDGLNPSSPIRRYADTFKTGTSLQKFAASFFDNGAHVGGILKAPIGASEDAINNVEEGVRQKVHPGNWFKTLILRDGFDFIRTTADMKAAQVSEMDDTEARHVSRIYNIPPSRLGIRDSVAYNSLEQEETRYYRSACGPHLIRVRSQCHKKLLLPSEQKTHFIDYLIDALQWTDGAARASIATQGIQAGWLEEADVRQWHNLPPKKGRDAGASDPAGSDPPSNSPPSNSPPGDSGGTGESDVQSTALNGAQVSSMVEVALLVATGILPKSSAEAILTAAFPNTSLETIRRIIEPIIVAQANQPTKQPAEPPPTTPQASA